MIQSFAYVAVLGLWWCGAGHAAEPVDYLKQIKPVLQARCFACHGALKQEAKLRLDTAALIRQGGDSGPAIQPGDVDASLILTKVSSTEESERMPPEGEPLTPEQIAALKAWIAAGANGPADERPERDPRDHWAFRTPVRPAVNDPRGAKSDRCVHCGETSRTWIDGAAARRQADVAAAGVARFDRPAADAGGDGCVPRGQVGGRLRNGREPPARQSAIRRTLGPALDGHLAVQRLVGLGAQVRNSQMHIWHFRDWIIESLNADKGYDQMLREMLAADELYPNDLDRLRASGFLARQYFKFNRTSWLDETIEHTSKAMLGLTFNCAKCHDHKYDPFTQENYYQFRSLFEPYQVRTDAIPGELDFEKDGIPRAFDCNLDAATFLHIRGDDRNPDKNRSIKPTIPGFLSFGEFAIQPVTLPAEAHQPGLRTFVVEAHLRQAEAKIAAAKTALETARLRLAEAETAARLAALDPATNRPADALAAVAGNILVAKDDFAVAKPDLWELRSGEWNYADGKLKQSQLGDNRAAIRLKQTVPADFEARLKYVPTGGAMWKSVGISFDVVETNEVLAYLSAVAGGSKSQIAYRQNGNYIYPPLAACAAMVALNKPQEILVRVRRGLVNVSINGQPALAYQLPLERRAGALELITYDASADFLSFELAELSPNTTLVDAPNPVAQDKNVPMAPDEARLHLIIAEKSLQTAELQPDSIQARAAADRAKSQQPPPANLAELIAQAVKAERVAGVAKGEEEVSRAELEVLKTAPGMKAEAVKKLRTARMARETASMMVGQPGETYAPLVGALKTLENNLETEDSRQKPFPQTSTGRRTALANWITDPKHPLPARVCVNHLWGRHFGKGLVPTVFDFGRKGTPPTHPELLDWLAVELVEHNWSMKHIHRLIVTSEAYRRSSSKAGANAQAIVGDPDNKYLWRMNSIRMEAQVVRDGLLHLAGELDLQRGGPSIPVADENSRRRSLYFVHSHNEHQKFLSIFDDASVLECYRRTESIVPQQALALENSTLAAAMAEKIAERIVAARPDMSAAEFVRQAFLLVLCDDPSEAELAATLAAFSQLTDAALAAQRPDPEKFARSYLVQSLLNHNDFVTVR